MFEGIQYVYVRGMFKPEHFGLNFWVEYLSDDWRFTLWDEQGAGGQM